MNIDKKQALERLEQLKKDMRELEKVINTPEKNWKDVTSVEKACEFMGNLSPNHLISVWKNAYLTDSQIAGLKLEYCIKAINEDWKPNWNSNSEYKWYNWFDYKGGGFSFYGASIYLSGVHLGSGFYYKNKEKAQFGAKHFFEYYKIWMS